MVTIYDINELQALVERQRIVIEKLLIALENAFSDYGGGRDPDLVFDELEDIYQQVSSADAMTGATEK